MEYSQIPSKIGAFEGFYDNLVEIELKIDFFCEKLAITVCDLNQIMAQKKAPLV